MKLMAGSDRQLGEISIAPMREPMQAVAVAWSGLTGTVTHLFDLEEARQLLSEFENAATRVFGNGWRR